MRLLVIIRLAALVDGGRTDDSAIEVRLLDPYLLTFNWKRVLLHSLCPFQCRK